MQALTENLSQRNWILAALPQNEMEIFHERGQKIVLHEGKTLLETGWGVESAFFPATAVVSLIGLTQEGKAIELGLVCREGVIGLPLFFGGPAQPLLQCQVQHGGEVCQIPMHVIREAHLRVLQALVCRYANYRLAELAQSAICNKFHSVRQRFCRWLLTTQDRSGKHELDFTQEMLAAMIGARRPVVTALIGLLQEERLIDYRRGCISILHRSGLYQSACECYAILSEALAEYQRSLISGTR